MPSEVRSAGANALPPNAEWIDLPPEAARRHPLYGISGWLVLFVFLFEFFIILDVGNLIIPNNLYVIPNQYLIIADSVFMVIIVTMILTKFNFLWVSVWLWVSFHFLGVIFAYSEFGADGVVNEQEKVIIAAYAVAFLLRDIPIVWYFTSSRRVNITINSRARPNDPFLRGIGQPRSNELNHAKNAAQDDPAPGLSGGSRAKARSRTDPPFQTKANSRTKVCPACAEIIKTQALTCRYCGYIFLDAGSPVEASKGNGDSRMDTSNAVKSSEKIDVPVVRNSVGLVEYRGFFIAEMENGKFQILSENGEKLKKSGDYDSSEYAMATLDFFITIAVELMSYPASLPRSD